MAATGVFFNFDDVGVSPVLVEVPHAGLAIPDLVRDEFVLGSTSVLRDSDVFVDRLCEHVPEQGAHLLSSNVSRYVVDLNRAATDRRSGAQGAVWERSPRGNRVLKTKLNDACFDQRIKLFYTPYHERLEKTLKRMKSEFDHVLLLAMHSMPSRGANRKPRADVVPGTQGGSTATPRLLQIVESHFRGVGLTVRHDDPYRGGYSTAHYGKPKAGVSAIQVELNRALYIDESTVRPHDSFELLKETIGQLVRKLVVELS